MIPKVAGYSGFDSYGVTAYSVLKPGQRSLDREYYNHANTEKRNGQTYLSSYSRFGTNHQVTVDKTVKPTDYKAASRSGKQNLQYELLHNPELFKYTKQGQLAESLGPKYQPRASSELKRIASTNVAGKVAALQKEDEASKNDALYKTTQHWVTNYQGENNNLLNTM